jgi:hypothetical protein
MQDNLSPAPILAPRRLTVGTGYLARELGVSYTTIRRLLGQTKTRYWWTTSGPHGAIQLWRRDADDLIARVREEWAQ